MTIHKRSYFLLTSFKRALSSLILVSFTRMCSSSSSSIMYSLLFLLSMSTNMALMDASHLTSEPVYVSPVNESYQVSWCTSNSFDHDGVSCVNVAGFVSSSVRLSIRVSQECAIGAMTNALGVCHWVFRLGASVPNTSGLHSLTAFVCALLIVIM
jgi:hypothetical protein